MPFTVKVRLWTMTDQSQTQSGETLTGPVLTRSDTTQKGCYDIQNYRLVLTLGACP